VELSELLVMLGSVAVIRGNIYNENTFKILELFADGGA
jgi:hypothetical protein